MSETFVNTKVCTECQGRCCKTVPGVCFPDDFDVSNGFNRLNEALESGRFCIDWWEGDPREGKDEYERGYFVRPAIKGREGVLFNPTWGGTCTFLTEQGCELDVKDRPKNCRMLEPREDENCVLHGENGKRGAAIAWLEYYEYFERIE